MDFAFTEEQELFRTELKRFAAAKLAPHYQPDDRTARMHESILPALADMGLLGLRVPTELGGQATDAVTVGMVAEELSRANVNATYALLGTTLISDIFLRSCSEAQQQAWLPPIADGTVLPALALTEPGHGSDAASIEVQARKTDRGWDLLGEKTSISNDAADRAVVFARTGAAGPKGISAFYVPLDDPRVTCVKLDDVANRAVGRQSIFFDRLPVTRDDLVGAEGTAFTSVMAGFEYSRAIIGLMALGAAAQAIDDAMDYARTRETFGAPISTRQGVAFPLVEHATYVAAARHLCYDALWRKDQGLEHTVQANMVKWWAPKVGVDAIHQALLTYGHAAWSVHNPQEQRMRDVMGFEIADGTAQISKLVVARALLGRRFAP